jgi:polyisoprenoid-binding protein YceI
MISRLALLLLALWSFPASAGNGDAPRGGTPLVDVSLTPGATTVAIRTYGLGLLPFDGRFVRFHGVLRFDPSDHARCDVVLQVDVASLSMRSDAITEMVRGPDFLDAARYPTLAYEGACGPGGIAGALTMHGVTRPFGLTLDWRGEAVQAVGRLRRADWGMTARPLLGGTFVRITVTVAINQR